jgi:hypothetical protein
MTVTALSPEPESAYSQILWQIDRFPGDNVETGVPVLSGSAGLQVSFQPSTAGSFRLTAYIDDNGNGRFDEGEQLGVLLFAVVRLTMTTSSMITNNTLEGSGSSSVVTDPSGSSLNAPMQVTATFLLQGGGASQMIGNSAIVIGNVGNLFSDSFTISYPAAGTQPPRNQAGVGTEVPGGPTPMVDTPASPPSGGNTAFRQSSVFVNLPPPLPPALGSAVRVSSADAPKFVWAFSESKTLNDWASTSGQNVFREFMAAYSNDFPQTYAALAQATWIISVIGIENGGWEDAGTPANPASSVSGNTVLQQPVSYPVQVLGLSFFIKHTVTYTP